MAPGRTYVPLALVTDPQIQCCAWDYGCCCWSCHAAAAIQHPSGEKLSGDESSAGKKAVRESRSDAALNPWTHGA